MRILSKGRYQTALLAAALVIGLGSEAGAWSYGSWGSSGSYGSAGSYGGSYGSYGSGGSYGSYGRVGIIGRIRARHAARHSHGSYGSYGSGGSYGSYGSHSVSYGSAGSYGGYGYGSAGSSGSYGGAMYSTPVQYSAPVETDCDGCTASTSTDAALETSGSAVIEVTVPADAKVEVNDKVTTSKGTSRSFVSNSLQAGQTYLYNFRVEFEQDGKSVVKNESVKISAGDRVALSFANEDLQLSAAAGATKTELKISVPAKAKVFLAGAETAQTGTERTYATHRLTAGETWSGYTVRVELEKDGETLSREETLTIKGGDTYELAFDFDDAADQLAAK